MAEPAAVPGVDPSRVSTPGELAACLDGLRRRCGLSYEAMEMAAAKLPSPLGGSRLEPLAKSTVGEIVTGMRLPARGKLVTFLTVCEVAPAAQASWLAAWERASAAGLTRPAGAVRVRDARPRLLGVHAAISVPGVPDDVPPQYVRRDVDVAEFGVWARVTAAAQAGGFVLLVGGSSVGKTRCAVEAVKALLPDWWLVHPAGPAELSALAQAPPPRTVVWLDELQRYLDGEHGLAGAAVRALLTGPHPVVIVGTLWPDRYAACTAVPAPGGEDPRARERVVLDLAAVIRVSADFSPAEQDRARAAAARDPRLAAALAAAGYGLTQTLAAAPQLVARWEDARDADPYAWAVLTAALDAARLGALAPLGPGLLRAAAPGYCTSAQLAAAPDNWFEQAVAYATGKLHGAAAALAPAGSGMGQIDGYTAADYLLQHASQARRTARVPASTWDALLTCVRDPADAARLADSARNRLLYRYAIPFFRHAADAGDGNAAWRLAELLAGCGDLDEAVQMQRARADAGDGLAACQLAGLLADRGDLEELRARADAGDEWAAGNLAWPLARRGDLEELRARADAGDRDAAALLPGLLADRGDLEELRARADAGNQHAAWSLAGLLADRGDKDEAVQILRARADAGDEHAVWLLVDRGDLDEAVQILRARADAGDWPTVPMLVRLLADRSDLDEAVQILRARADAGDWSDAERLASLLAERGDLEELRARADAGDFSATLHLASLLARLGDVDELRARADAGDGHAAELLASLLAERGDLDGLRARADAGDRPAAERLASLLAERGDLEELRARADAGDGDAVRLAEVLTQQGRAEEAERLLRFGLNPDGSIACE